MRTIVPNPISLTTHHLRLCFRETDAVLSTGTGFIYAKGETSFLVTNWHNVSGRHPQTEKCLSNTLAVPDMLQTFFRSEDNPGVCHLKDLELYRDAAMEKPGWLEHPIHGHAVDVVAIPVPQEIEKNYKLFSINAIDFNSNFKTLVGDEAFVVGYPFSDATHLALPIWKKASVASEPDVDIERLPKFLIDTATRSGLSGSPVIMRRIGIHGGTSGEIKGSELIGEIRNFIGVYSGRIGADEIKAQLGIVWKAHVIDEIIEGKVFGCPLHKVVSGS